MTLNAMRCRIELIMKLFLRTCNYSHIIRGIFPPTVSHLHGQNSRNCINTFIFILLSTILTASIIHYSFFNH